MSKLRFVTILLLLCVLSFRTVNSATLHEAIICNNYNQVRQLLDAGADINKKDAEGYTPLLVAAAQRQDRIAQLLIERGAELDIFSAVLLGMAQEAEALLNQGIDVNLKNDKNGESLLHVAVGFGRLDVAEMLIARGADLNAVNRQDETPLILATQAGDIKIVKLLINSGADLSLVDNFGEAAVHHLAESGDEDIALLLIGAGADINTVDEMENTPLHYAARSHSPELIQVLIEHGAGVNAKNENGETPLSEAVDNCYLTAVTMLVDAGADVKEGNESGNNLLHYYLSQTGNYNCEQVGILLYGKGAKPNLVEAAALGLTDEVRGMLEQGVDVNEGTDYFGSPIMQAIEGGRNDVVELLLEHGVDVNESDGLLLCLAAMDGSTDISELLISHGAHVNNTCEMGTDSPLKTSVESGHTDVVKLLLDHGADVNYRDEEDGRTPLFYAAEKGFSDILLLLIEHGADVNAERMLGMRVDTPLLEAAENGHPDAARILIENGADINFETAFLLNRFEDMKRFIDQGRDVNDPINFDEMPLHRAARAGFIDIVAFLLFKGADVNLVDQNGETPLLAAIQNGRDDVARLLLDHGATLDILSALYMNRIDVAEQLIKQGIDINKPKKRDLTLLDSAIYLNRPDIVQFLLDNGADIHQDCGSPLRLAVYRNYLDVTRLLLDRGADMFASNERSRLRRLPTESFFKNNHLHEDMARLLIEYGAPVDIYAAVILDMQDDLKRILNDGHYEPDDLYELLHEAAARENTEVVRILLDSGSTIQYEDNWEPEYIGDFTPLDVSALNGHDEIVRMLVARGAAHSLFSASALGLDLEIENLMNKSDNKTTREYRGYKPLHVAAFFDNDRTVKLLIEKRFNVNNNRNWREISALHIASLKGNIATMRVLLEHGANVRMIDRKFGETPLHKAAKSGNTDTVALLLDYKANINEPNLFGCTSLDVAMVCATDKAQILEQNGGLPGKNCYKHTIDCEKDFSITD